MKNLCLLVALGIAGCASTGGQHASQDQGEECSRDAFAALSQEVARAKAASRATEAEARRNSTDGNWAAAAAAAADIAIAQAVLAVAKEECGG